MFEHSDAFVALPGGIGTLEELVEQMTGSNSAVTPSRFCSPTSTRLLGAADRAAGAYARNRVHPPVAEHRHPQG
jgi:predicted Rossmann-fold nucleotide-binding protein